MTHVLDTALAAAAPAVDLAALSEAEPLVTAADVALFKSGFDAWRAGRWDDGRWTTFRLRFGIYQERRPGLHMVRVKVPGGTMTVDQADDVARIARDHADGAAHITTRQGLQLYGVRTDSLGALIESLAEAGLTTREASGSTFRAICACPYAGACPREHVDAAAVAERLTTSWLRHPLVQHMPRKFKTAVSGCAHDCAGVGFDDLGFIATARNGVPGFRVLAGGGLGAKPRAAIELFDFVAEADLAVVQEAVARVHNAHSDRKRKHAARIKMLVERLGAEEFVRLVGEEFARVRALPRRPWAPLNWRVPVDGPAPRPVDGPFIGHDGGAAVTLRPTLGWLPSDLWTALADLARGVGAAEWRLTRDQGIVISGLSASRRAALIDGAGDLGVAVAGPEGRDVGACTGTEFCPIGITQSHAMAETLLARADIDLSGGLRLRVSGCQNSCGHHHIADIGLHGESRKIDGVPVAHYALHIGGRAAPDLRLGVEGPTVPAVNAGPAVAAVLDAWRLWRTDGEGLHAWATRLGTDGLEALLAPFQDVGDVAAALIEPGTDAPFAPPKAAAGECAAPALVAEYVADAGYVGLDDVRRARHIGDAALAIGGARLALEAPARRLLAVDGLKVVPETADEALAEVRTRHAAAVDLLAGLEAARAAVTRAEGGDWSGVEDALALWIAVAEAQAEAVIAAKVAKEAA